MTEFTQEEWTDKVAELFENSEDLPELFDQFARGLIGEQAFLQCLLDIKKHCEDIAEDELERETEESRAENEADLYEDEHEQGVPA